MELTTQVRIHRSVAASDVSASCSNHACSLAVVIWTYTFAVAISRLMPDGPATIHVNGCCQRGSMIHITTNRHNV